MIVNISTHSWQSSEPWHVGHYLLSLPGRGNSQQSEKGSRMQHTRVSGTFSWLRYIYTRISDNTLSASAAKSIAPVLRGKEELWAEGSLVNPDIGKNPFAKEEMTKHEGSFSQGTFTAIFLEGKRGKTICSGSRSIWIPLMWVGFLISTMQEEKLQGQQLVAFGIQAQPLSLHCLEEGDWKSVKEGEEKR